MATIKPKYLQKGQTACIDQCVTDSIFKCFSTTGLYKGRQVEITVDDESVTASDDEFEVTTIETVICFRVCEVPKPCNGDVVIACGNKYTVDKIIHNDGVCQCVTVKDCGSC